jgi:hypothetical protein
MGKRVEESHRWKRIKDGVGPAMCCPFHPSRMDAWSAEEVGDQIVVPPGEPERFPSGLLGKKQMQEKLPGKKLIERPRQLIGC